MVQRLDAEHDLLFNKVLAQVRSYPDSKRVPPPAPGRGIFPGFIERGSGDGTRYVLKIERMPQPIAELLTNGHPRWRLRRSGDGDGTVRNIVAESCCCAFNKAQGETKSDNATQQTPASLTCTIPAPILVASSNPYANEPKLTFVHT